MAAFGVYIALPANCCRESVEPDMHELYIAECILKSVQRSLPVGCQASDVDTVHVRVGKLDAVVPDSLSFLFDAIKSAQGMPNARLELEEEDVRCQCKACRAEFSLTEPLFQCPECQYHDLKLIAGRGITLMKFTVKEREVCGHTGCK